MKYINKVELQGKVGHVRLDSVDGRQVAHFSVATFQVLREGGEAIVETTWHSVLAAESNVLDLDKIEKGSAVHIIGRIKNREYTDNAGTTLIVSEIIANKVELINK